MSQPHTEWLLNAPAEDIYHWQSSRNKGDVVQSLSMLIEELHDERDRRAELVEALRLALKVTEIDCQETGTRPFPWFHTARALLEKIGG